MLFTLDDIQNALRRVRAHTSRNVIEREGLVPAAVLIPILSLNGETYLLLTRRTDTVETHKGHVAFPGGMVDEEDADRVATALRETREELGIGPDEITPLGALDDLATPTGFIITPIIGYLRTMPGIVPNPDEVAEVFLVPLSFLFADKSCRRETRETEFGTRETWRYDYEGKVIWGATAAIIRDLGLLLQPPPS
jgi:8-oxo-dGTP pyrophosphatase MutT (NUDIX family)